MNLLSTCCTRRLVRPQLLALAAALALPATVGAQATNNWRCAGGGWNGDPVCWSLGTPNSTQNVVIPAGPTGSDLMLLTAIGNNVSMRQLTVGDTRGEHSTSATAYLYASGSTINVNGTLTGPGNVNVGNADNAHAQLTLTNNSTLNLGQGGGFSRGTVYVGKPFGNAFSNVQLGIGSLSVQGGSRINGNVAVNNGRLDVAGHSDPGYVAIMGEVFIGNNPVLGAASNIAGSVTDLRISGARANIGMTSASLAAPTFNSVVAITSGVADFVGRSFVNNLQAQSGGVVNINRDARVEAANPTVLSGGRLAVQSGGALSGYVLYNNQGGSVDLMGGTINHRGIDNAGTVSGSGVIDSVLEAQTFKQQATGLVQASGGDLILYGRFDGSAGGALATQDGGRLFFFGDTAFKAGQLITQSGTGGLVVFGAKVDIGTAAQRGSFGAMTADLALQNTSNLFLDFGGATDHDYLATGGKVLVEGGKLTLRTAGSFQAGLGSFNILRASSGITGAFSSIDATAFALAPGARLDLSNLYTTGTLAVVAVPEPAPWLSLGAGLLLIGARARRWRQMA